VAGNTPKGLLNIPEQSKPTTDSFDARPKQVEAWMEALPMANIGESARRVYSALREMNRLKLSSHDRFKAMEVFRTPAYQITEALKKHYTHQNLPLSPKNQKISELAICLNAEMALGYKCIIDNKLETGFSLLSNKTLTTSMHRTIRYLSNLLLCTYQVYIQHPEHTWLQIHRLYLYAEENKLHTATIKDHVVTEALPNSSIADLYKQILLMALAGPYRLRQHVTEAVYSALETWAVNCYILPYSEMPTGDYAFTINMNTDAAPGYFLDDASANPVFCRTIDTRELASAMSNSLRSSLYTPGSHSGHIPEDVQKRLLMTWSGKSHRHFSRTAKSNQIAITLGLSATHHYIDEIIRPLQKDPSTICAAATETLQANAAKAALDDNNPGLDNPANYTSAPVFGISNLDNHTPDAWDLDFTFRANNPANRLQTDNEDSLQRKATLYSPLSCKGINESAGGYCLLGYLDYNKDAHKVQVGELVGIRDNMDCNSTQLSIGVIRRIKNWKNGLELGIQKLAPCADAIATATATVPKDNASEKYQRSLVLPELPGIDQPATLITHAWHQAGDPLTTNVHGHRTRIALSKQMESTGVFSRFEFNVLEDVDTQSVQPDGPQSNDEFDTVWTLI
jgi:hypothetical protein